MDAAQREKHSWLNHENEITRRAAAEVYDEYIKMGDKERYRRYIEGKTW
jgi:hypothetical protein